MTSIAAGNERRAEIVATGARLFAARGIAHTSIRDIGDASGILGTSLYHHFKSKDDLVDLIVRGTTEALDDLYKEAMTSSDNPRDLFAAMVRASFKLFERFPEANVIYMNDFHYLAARPRFDYLKTTEARHHKMWRSIVASGIESGDFRADLDAGPSSRLVQDAVWITARRWASARRRRPPLEQLTEGTLTFLLGGLAGNARGPGA
jgi:AcrR family transcriptional regulator